MATIISKEETAELLKNRNKGGKKKEIYYLEKITGLGKGESLFIPSAEWPLKTLIPNYYYGKFNKGGSKQITCNKVIRKGKKEGKPVDVEGYLVRKA